MSLTEWWEFYCPFMAEDLDQHVETAYEAEKSWLLETSLLLGETVRFRDATAAEMAGGVFGPVPLFRKSLFVALPHAVHAVGENVVWAAVRDRFMGLRLGAGLPQAVE